MKIFKKKKIDSIKMSHYEGLPNIPFNATCIIKKDDNGLIISQILENNSASLAWVNIKSTEYMRDVDFMRRHKNTNIPNPPSIMDVVFYWVITYIDSYSDEEKYIIFSVLSLDAKGIEKFTKDVNSLIPPFHVVL